MTSPNVPEDGLVDNLLDMEGPKGLDPRRARILARTTSVVRRRRWLRRLGVVAALAGCYLAGMATTQACRSPSAPSATSIVEEKVRPEDKRGERGPPTRGRSESPETEHQLPVDRPDAPHAAVAGTGFDEVRRMGDRFLEEKGDVLGALDCYARALDRASSEELAVRPDEDNWLLMALKLDRIEENRNVDRGA
jgi:hypothetical protein